jgi:hypothetical protein
VCVTVHIQVYVLYARADLHNSSTPIGKVGSIDEALCDIVSKGPEGQRGEKGEVGPTGPPGMSGEKGPRGKRGKRVSICLRKGQQFSLALWFHPFGNYVTLNM